MAWIVPDFETVSSCDLKKAGAWRYAEDPTTEILCLSFENDRGEKGTWFPGDPIPEILAQAIADPHCWFVAHNAQFEKAIWRLILVALHGWADIPNSRWHDTLAMCAMMVIPQELEKALLVLRLKTQKDMEGNKLTIGLSKVDKKTGMMPRITPPILARVGEYCETDVTSQVGLHRRLGWMPKEERRVWLLNQKVNERGLRIDMPLVRAMQAVVDKARPPLEQEFRELTGGLNMTQLAKFKLWVEARGVYLPNMTKETLDIALGAEDDEEAVADPRAVGVFSLPPEVERPLRIRQLIGSSSLTKLEAMEACVMADGRARGLLQYHGTGPGRSAGRMLQPHNFPKGTIKGYTVEDKVQAIMTRDPAYIEAVIGKPPVETIVSSLRHALIANPDRVLLAGDYAGIQARTVLALAGQHDKTALLAAGLNPYIDMALQIWPELERFDLMDKKLVELFKAMHAFEYGIGKNSVLGLGFQMAGLTFQTKYASDQPIEFCDGVVKTYRDEWAPKVPLVWAALQKASLEAVKTGQPQEAYGIEYKREDEWLTARLLSGRKMWYFNPQLVRRRMPWSTEEEPDIRLAWTYQAIKNKHLVTIDAFGGQETENVVMGIERDIMTHGMLLCEENGFPIVLEVHDEIVTEPLEKGVDEKAFDQIMTDVPDWARQLQVPVAVETWVSKRYKK